jgi:hypothetical protein
MRDALLLLVVGLALAGCAPVRSSANDASDDTVQIWRPGTDDADFISAVLNRQTLMFNGDLWADRISVVGARLKSLGCRDPRLVREKAEALEGTWSSGRKRVLYYGAWKCA